jgi:hypothetical protein
MLPCTIPVFPERVTLLSLLADNTGLRQLPFDWQISIERGFVDYETWFKVDVRD